MHRSRDHDATKHEPELRMSRNESEEEEEERKKKLATRYMNAYASHRIKNSRPTTIQCFAP